MTRMIYSMNKKSILALVISFMTAYSASAQDSPVTSRYSLLVEEYFSYFERNQMDSAELVLRQAIELMPDADSNFLLQGNLAELVLARKDTIQAISLLSSALGAQPEMHRLRERRAQLLAEMGRNNEALGDLDYIVKQQPDLEVPRYRRVLLYMNMGLWDGAKGDLEAIIRTNDNAYLPRVTLAKVERMRGDERAAERLLSHLIEKFPDTPVAYRERARLYIQQDRKAEALKDIRTVIHNGKEVTDEDYQIRGDIWVMYGDQAQAKKDYDTAKKLRESVSQDHQKK